MNNFIFKLCVYISFIFSNTIYATTHNINLSPNGEQYIYVTMKYLAPLNTNYVLWKYVPRCIRYQGSVEVHNNLSNKIAGSEFGEIIIEPVGSEAPLITFGQAQTVAVKMKVYSRGASIYDPEFEIYCDGRAIQPGGDIGYSTADPFDSRLSGQTTKDTIKLSMPKSPIIKVFPNTVDLGECLYGSNDFEGQFNVELQLTGGVNQMSDVMQLKVKTNPDLPIGSNVTFNGNSLLGSGVALPAIFGVVKNPVDIIIPCPEKPGIYNWSMTVINEHN